uniref:Uncharacterized protein n=1 Tax=Romanomermis culicivorax TaxID=13658 RepID=A0A915JB96_ROMCU
MMRRQKLLCFDPSFGPFSKFNGFGKKLVNALTSVSMIDAHRCQSALKKGLTNFACKKRCWSFLNESKQSEL